MHRITDDNLREYESHFSSLPDRNDIDNEAISILKELLAARKVINSVCFDAIYQWHGWKDSELKKALEAFDKLVNDAKTDG